MPSPVRDMGEHSTVHFSVPYQDPAFRSIDLSRLRFSSDLSFHFYSHYVQYDGPPSD